MNVNERKNNDATEFRTERIRAAMEVVSEDSRLARDWFSLGERLG